jgi:hypothetical protein
MCDAAEVKHRILIFERIETGVVAKGSFSAQFVEMHVAFENNFGRGRDFQIHGLTLHQLHRFLA